jgi:DNA-binding NarL/FixJ family response regulator
VIRVFIVAASPVVRSGLENLLAARDVAVVGRATSLETLSGELLDAEPDAVVFDASNDNPHKVLEELTASNLSSDTSIILLLDHAPPGFVAEAIRAGVRAVLPSQVTAEQLGAAVRATVEGLFLLHSSDVQNLFPAASLAAQPLAELPEALTPREREVLQMLASGLANKEIAAKLSISDHTVKFHVASILGKLGAATRTEAVALGIRRGLVLL